MPAHVKCPACSTVLQLPDAAPPSGMVRCPKCTTVLRVPGQAAAPPANPPAPLDKPKPPAPAAPSIRKSAPPPIPTVPPTAPKKPSSRPPSAPPVRHSRAIKTAPPKAPASRPVAAASPPAEKRKSNKRLVAGILGCVGLLFLACGGGIGYGVYWILNTGKTVSQKLENLSKDHKEDQAKQDAGADGQKPPDNNVPANVLDVSFIHSDFNAAFVFQPARIVQSSSPLLPSREERNRLIDQGIQATGIDFSKVGQFIVVLGPTPPAQPRPRSNSPRPRPGMRPPAPPARPEADEPAPFVGAAILRFTEPVDDMAIMVKALRQMDRVEAGGKTYYRSKTEKQDGQPLAGHYDGNRTVLLGPEPLLRKMLTAKNAVSPLGEKLREFGLEHDLFGVFLVEPIRSMLKDLAQSPTTQKQFPTAKTLNEDLNVVRLTANLDGDKLMRIILEGKDDAAAKNLEELADGVLNLGKVMYPQIKPIIQKETSPESAASVIKVTDQFLKKEGITVTREGNTVFVTLNKPKDL